MVGVFGFKNEFEFSRDECFLYFYSLINGLMKVIIRKGEIKPCFKRFVNYKDVLDITNQIFLKSEYVISRDEFIEYNECK
jgi:hypothetical protein